MQEQTQNVMLLEWLNANLEHRLVWMKLENMDQDSFQTGLNWFYVSVTDLEKSLVSWTGSSVRRNPDYTSIIMKIQKAKNW